MVKPLSLWLAATRPAFLTVTFVGVLLGLATAQFNGVFHSPWLAVMTLTFALVAHAGANVINDYYDAISGCDAINQDRIFPFTGGSRFIQNGVLTPKLTALFGYSLLLSVIPAGLYLVIESGAGLIAIGLCGLFAGWAYSAQPIALQSRGIGELAITMAWMMVVVGSDYVQRGAFSLTPFVTGLAYALLVANVLFINQIPDLKADEATGKRTIIVRFGRAIAPKGSGFLYLLSNITLIVGIMVGILPPVAAMALVVCVSSAIAVYKLHAGLSDKNALTIAIRLTIINALIFGLLLALALLIA